MIVRQKDRAMTDPARFIDGPNARLAVRSVSGAGPTVVWLGGFKSDMLGTKAERLSDWAREAGRAFVRFDYSGHGESGGQFEDGTISKWTADALHILDTETKGPLVLVGSSMGGWIALLTALARKERISGLVLIAPAPDFTEDLLWASLTEDQRRMIETEGRLEEPSDYADEPYVYTRALTEDGRKNLLLGAPIDLDVPVRILQGAADPDVPWRHAARLMDVLTGDDVVMTLDRVGDHRMSEPRQLEMLARAVGEVSGG